MNILKHTDGSFYGVLGKIYEAANGLVFRFYPFTFENDPNSKSVFQVEVIQPKFSLSEIKPWVGSEVDVECDDNVLKLYDSLDGSEIVLNASETMRYEKVCYTIDDFVDRVSGLEAAWQQEYDGNINGQRKLNELRSLTDELLHRADIKAASSKEQSKLQQSAIKVLNRIKATLRDNGN